MTKALINKKMLTWARERIGADVPTFAKKLGVDEERLSNWEGGGESITFAKAIEFAKKAYVPFGYLYLNEPPQEKLPIPDLRTVNGHGVSKPSAELFDLIKLMLDRQDWYKDYLISNLATPVECVGRASLDQPIIDVVEDIRAFLNVAPHPNRGKWDDYYRDLVKRIESIGVSVMRQSDINHYSRPLNVDEFRGFALCDEYAPVIFVNHADAPGPRLFTLIHELCHIWLNQSGISDGDPSNKRAEEKFCNAVAAEFLVPGEEFIAKWRFDVPDWRENLPELEAHFHVSKWVIARRALTFNFIDKADYGGFIQSEREAFQKRDKGGGSPSYYQTKQAQISRNFSAAVAAEASTGRLLLKEAASLLAMPPSTVMEFSRRMD